MAETQPTHPKLRLIDAKPIQYEGETYLLLSDPLGLAERTLLVPQPMIPALALCDGTRTPSVLRAALALRYGLFLTQQRIDGFLTTLDDALLLDNERSRQAIEVTRAAFRAAPNRPPANAGLSYPDEPGELAALLQNYIDALDGAARPADRPVRGVVSPHIDFQRGGPVYARVWNQAARAVQEADLAIIFGTDHFSEGHPFSLTRQNYATPFGVLPTAVEIVDELASVFGEGEVFAGELHHRREHSIELAAVWMHHMRGGRPLETVPILAGSLKPEHQHPSERFPAGLTPDHPALEDFLNVLRRAMAGRKALVVAAGDLAHVGPAFDTAPVGPGERLVLQQADQALIDAMCRGDAPGFYEEIERVDDQNNVCGTSSIYLTLRLLAPLNGEPSGYEICPADQQNTSVVTICGVTLR